MGAMIARDGRDVRSSIGNDAGQRDSDGSHIGKIANMEVAPLRGGSVRAHMEAAPAAWGQRLRVTEETFGAVSCVSVCASVCQCVSLCVCVYNCVIPS